MSLWTMDDWNYLERRTVFDPQGHTWSVTLMDLLGQEDDPENPSIYAEAAFAAGRFYTIIYAGDGGIRYERGYRTLEEAREQYRHLLARVADGSMNPSQPVFRADLED